MRISSPQIVPAVMPPADQTPSIICSIGNSEESTDPEPQSVPDSHGTATQTTSKIGWEYDHVFVADDSGCFEENTTLNVSSDVAAPTAKARLEQEPILMAKAYDNTTLLPKKVFYKRCCFGPRSRACCACCCLLLVVSILVMYFMAGEIFGGEEYEGSYNVTGGGKVVTRVSEVGLPAADSTAVHGWGLRRDQQ